VTVKGVVAISKKKGLDLFFLAGQYFGKRLPNSHFAAHEFCGRDFFFLADAAFSKLVAGRTLTKGLG
jgi:hypothetical protein